MQSKESNSYEDDPDFRAFVTSNLNPERYRQIYGDVLASGADPVEHWLNHGLYEGRSMQSGLLVLRSKTPHHALGATWRRFVWRGEYIAVRSVPLSPSLRRQILDQARHEPAVLPPNALSLDCLPYAYRAELLNRDGLDVEAILSAITARPKLVVILPSLQFSEAAKYAADLTDAILEKHGGPALVLITEQTAQQATNWQGLSILSPLRATNLVFWRDTCGRSHANSRMFAVVLNFLRPKHIVVVNSTLGLDAIARYGNGLSQSARLYCAVLGSGANEVAAVAMKFARRTLPFAVALADSEGTATTLKSLYGELPGPGVAVLPSRLLPAPEDIFAARLSSRRSRARSTAGQARWACISPCEPVKGTAILAILATLRPQDQFEIYGSSETGLEKLNLALPNIIHRGVVHDVATANFTSCDGFVFTSLFEGISNIVLEMSQHAIPMVLADAANLRANFGDFAALFVKRGISANDTAANFSCALNRIVGMTAEEITTMGQAARKQALFRHAPAVHADAVVQLFDLV